MAVRLGFGRWGRVPLAIGMAIVMQTGYGMAPATGQSDGHVVSVDDVWASEGDEFFFFRLTRTRATGRPISISYQTVDGDAIGGKDYETAHGTVTFGPQEESAFVRVSILDDAEDESDEIFELALLSPPGGVTIARPRSRATIRDDDRLELPVKALAVTDLGTPGPTSLTGYERSRGVAITNESRIAGTTSTPVYTAYGFTSSGGQVQATWSLGGTARSGPGVSDMNDAGQVVGSIGGEPSRAFLWENGVLRELGNPFGGESWETWSVATAINGRARVVGTAAVVSGPDARAFLWESGVFVDIGTLGGSISEAEDINANGDVVGSAETAAGASHAFVWRAGTMTDLGTLGGSSSRATAINDVGQIVGQSQTASGVWHMFLWQNGVMTDLGARGNATVPSDINNGGQIVGSIGDGSQWLAFLWEAGTFWGLPKLEPAFPDGAYNLDTAVAINDAGQIVGSSELHAVRWG